MPWYRKTASELENEAGADAHALFRLARMVEHGFRGASPDPERGRQLLRRAADAGSAGAALSLGDRSYRGKGVAQDVDDGLRWYRRAAELGSANGQSNVGSILLERGDRDEAEGWLRKAAAQGQPYAVTTLAHLSQGQSGPDPHGLVGIDIKLTIGGDETQLNDAIGTWVDVLFGRWPDLAVRAEVAGEAVDFPGLASLPANVCEDYDDIAMTLTLGADGELACGIGWGSKGWQANLHTSAPYLTEEVGDFAVKAFEAAAAGAGMTVTSRPD